MKKLAVLGASYLQQPLIEKANEMGIQTHCFAWDNEEAVCKNTADFFYPVSVLEKEQILEKCLQIGIDGITTIATDICIPVIAFVADRMNLVSNSLHSAFLATNKGEMRKAFASNGVHSPQSLTVSKPSDATGKLNFPLIVKPTDRSGSRGVTKVSNQAELDKAIERAIHESLEKKAVIEEFVEGSEVSVESISWKGQHYILAITDKVTTGAPYFVELEHHQPSLLPENMQQRIISETIKALDALQIEYGAGHSEFKITADGKVVAIEVGARMGGDFIGSHLVPLSTGYDFLKGVVDVALHHFEEPVFGTSQASGVYFLCEETAHLKPYFSSENAFDIEKALLKEQLISIKNSNDRSGFLIYQAAAKIELI